MNRDQEDLLLNIVSDWNSTVGGQLSVAIAKYRNNDYYARRYDEQFSQDMGELLNRAAAEIEKRPQAAKEIIGRALKLLTISQPKKG